MFTTVRTEVNIQPQQKMTLRQAADLGLAEDAPSMLYNAIRACKSQVVMPFNCE